MQSLTRRQADTLAAIVAHKLAHDGCSPTVRQLTRSLALSTTSATHFHLTALVAKGWITIDRANARSIQVIGARWIPPPAPELQH